MTSSQHFSVFWLGFSPVSLISCTLSRPAVLRWFHALKITFLFSESCSLWLGFSTPSGLTELRFSKPLEQWQTSQGWQPRVSPTIFNSKLVHKLLVLWGVTHRIATLLPSLPRIGTPFCTHKAWQHFHLLPEAPLVLPTRWRGVTG